MKNIIDQIGKNDFKSVFQYLNKNTVKSDDLLVLKTIEARYNRWNKETISRIVSEEKRNLRINQIVYDLLNFISNFTNTDELSEKQEQHIKFDYMRLFGAIEVPLIMDLIENGDNLTFEAEESFGKWQGDYLFYKTSKGKLIQQDLVKFWKKEWKYKNLRPVLTPLWRKYSGKKRRGIDLYWSSIEKKEDLFQLAINSDIDEAGSFANEIKNKFKVGYDNWETIKGLKSEDIGFTFLIFKNFSNTYLFDISVECLTIAVKEPKEFEASLFYEKIEDFPNINFEKTLSENKVDIEQRKILKISNIEPKGGFILLNNIYVANENFLPGIFKENILIPQKITYNYDNMESVSYKIRNPYLEKAARIKIPSGWLGQ